MASALRAGVHMHGREHVCTVHMAFKTQKRLSVCWATGRYSEDALVSPPISYTGCTVSLLGAPPRHSAKNSACLTELPNLGLVWLVWHKPVSD